MMEEFTRQYDGKVIIGKCDVETGNDLVVEFKIRSIPTLLFLWNGQVVDKIFGAVNRKKIESNIISAMRQIK